MNPNSGKREEFLVSEFSGRVLADFLMQIIEDI